tara:strand:+ start:195 stop:473 length:279 start_codon:yes stop_codon:yes gene_type:complete
LTVEDGDNDEAEDGYGFLCDLFDSLFLDAFAVFVAVVDVDVAYWCANENLFDITSLCLNSGSFPGVSYTDRVPIHHQSHLEQMSTWFNPCFV